MQKTNLAPLGVALHGVAIAVGFLVLLAAISTPPAFVGATAAMAGASILVTAKGDKLRSLGNFTFIPALYLACEAAEGTPRAALLERGLSFLPYIAAALLPVIVLAAAEHVRDRDLGVSHIRHLTRFRGLPMTSMWRIFRSTFTVLVRLHERSGFLVGFLLMQWTKASRRVW
jgi:hypothetical protein